MLAKVITGHHINESLKTPNSVAYKVSTDCTETFVPAVVLSGTGELPLSSAETCTD